MHYVGQNYYKTHGGRGGGSSEVILELGEYITKIEGAEHPAHNGVAQFKLFSNKGIDLQDLSEDFG